MFQPSLCRYLETSHPEYTTTGFSSQRLGFDPRAFGMEFVLDKMTQGQVIPGVLLFSPLSNIPPVLIFNSFTIYAIPP
jgi:hypothetical protein